MKAGILLTNLGTPEAPTKPALRRYLKKFLSDPRVVNPPSLGQKIIWKLVLNFIILPTRPKKSAENYAKIWGKFGSGSPLLDISQMQLDKVKALLDQEFDDLEFAIGMRYGQPSVHSALRDLRDKGCREIIVMPLYPQQSGPTTLSTLDVIEYELSQWKQHGADVAFVQSYYDDPNYIEALYQSVMRHQAQFGKPEKLVMSYHGMPQRYVDEGDVYYQQCLATSELLAKRLELDSEDYVVSFQSVFGKEQWIKPYTDATLKSLAKDGIKHVQVICPGFSADCLETLEEIEVENKDYFLEAGGERFEYIAALNDDQAHIQMIVARLSQYL